MKQGISAGAYAQHRRDLGLPGGTPRAVQEAIAAGRLKRCLVAATHGGRKTWRIADVVAADAEWKATTNTAMIPLTGPAASKSTKPAKNRDSVSEPVDLSLSEESAREKFWKAQIAELDYRERLGDLVDAKEMQAKLSDVFTRCRGRLLGLPTRAKQQCPHLTITDIGTLDGIVREALETLATELEGERA
jgi:hypothetical protein